MLYKLKSLPENWLELVNDFDTNKVNTIAAQIIAEKMKGFVLDKKESIIGANLVQSFIKAVIEEAFSEIKGEIGLHFCEKIISIKIELFAFDEILQAHKFIPIEKERKEGQSDFFIEKDGIEYEAEVKFKMGYQSFHNTITSLIIGQTMINDANELVNKRVEVNIKLEPKDINDSNKNRIYSDVVKWCQKEWTDFNNDDIEISIKDEIAKADVINIQCGDRVQWSYIPKPDEISKILLSPIRKIKKQFDKRNPANSIGIIVWHTTWGYDTEESDQIVENIEKGIRNTVGSCCKVCDQLYVYPTILKRSLLFEHNEDN